ncbi:MAG: MBL fold metallo-hydrolase [Candidatus Hodarchaeota archaeon]
MKSKNINYFFPHEGYKLKEEEKTMLKTEKITEHVFLVSSNTKDHFKCNGIVITNVEGGKVVMIDCNFQEQDVLELFEKFGNDVIYFISHVHLDHVQDVHVYEKHNIPIYCPVPEHEYIKNIEQFMEYNGAVDHGVDKIFLTWLKNSTRFQQLKENIPFTPGDVFEFENVVITTIALPGHSPGHVGFEIIRKYNQGKSREDVLFVSDIGIETFGPWYGFKNCNLHEYRRSVDLIETIYNNYDYILLSSHGPPIREKDRNLFPHVRKKLDWAKDKVKLLLESGKTEYKQFIYKGVYYPVSLMDGMDNYTRRIFLFFEACSIQNLLDDLEEN